MEYILQNAERQADHRETRKSVLEVSLGRLRRGGHCSESGADSGRNCLQNQKTKLKAAGSVRYFVEERWSAAGYRGQNKFKGFMSKSLAELMMWRATLPLPSSQDPKSGCK